MKLIRYPGSKHKSANKLFDLLPKNIREYREPFLGSGAVFGRVWKHFHSVGQHPRYWLNDIPPALIDLYRRVKKEDGYAEHLIAVWNSLIPEAEHMPEIMDAVEEFKIEYHRLGDTNAMWFLFALGYGSFISNGRPHLCS